MTAVRTGALGRPVVQCPGYAAPPAAPTCPRTSLRPGREDCARLPPLPIDRFHTPPPAPSLSPFGNTCSWQAIKIMQVKIIG